MSVVVVLPGSASMSVSVGTEARFDDTEQDQYTYYLHGGGALLVLIAGEERRPEPHVVYGPGAWLRVEGTHSTV